MPFQPLRLELSDHDQLLMDIYEDGSRWLELIEAKCMKLASQAHSVLLRKPTVSPELAQLQEFAAKFSAQLDKVINDGDEAGMDDFERSLPELTRRLAWRSRRPRTNASDGPLMGRLSGAPVSCVVRHEALHEAVAAVAAFTLANW